MVSVSGRGDHVREEERRYIHEGMYQTTRDFAVGR